MPYDFQDVSISINDKIATIAINRPEVLNAIRIQTYKDLIAAFQQLDQDDQVNSIILTGNPKMFTAGNDLSDLVEEDDIAQVGAGVEGIFTTLSELKKPVIAAVEGVAVGIGTTILLHCDMLFAGDKTRFRMPFTHLGVCPEGCSSLLLERAVGQKIASELLLTGRFFTADEADKWNFLNGKCEAGTAHDVAVQTAQELNKLPLDSLITTKQLLKKHQVAEIQQACKDEMKEFVRLLNTPESKARVGFMLKGAK